MSQHRNHELSSWKDVLIQLRRTETTWRGIPLSRLDHATYTEAILLGAMVLNDLSNRCEGFGSKRDHVNWATRVVSIDVGDLAAFLSDVIALWRRLSLADDPVAITNYGGFKRHLSGKYPFAGDFLAPMRGAVDLFLADHTPASFAPVYQALSFLNHLTLVDIDMSDELENGYLEHEERLAALHLPRFLVQQLNEIMRDWLRDFRVEPDKFLPKHGPGGVAELKGDTSLESKYRELAPNALIRYVFLKHSDLDVAEFCPIRNDYDTSLQSRIVFVPKSMKTKRVISAEPATLQYFQQGVDRAIRKYISTHSYLRKRIDLHDQSKQRDAALRASRNRSHATVDLSAASDSIHYDLAKGVFKGTALYPYLVALRSRTAILPSGKVVELTKFAPMGSALTFPIESLIFACILECTARYVRGYSGLNGFKYRTYGDDIVVPDCCLTDLVANLHLLGFQVNEDKSYGGNYRFRESCGCDAYDGVDVTPLRISRRFAARRVTSRTPDVFAGLIDMANNAYQWNLPLLRRYIIDKLINDGPFIPLFSEDGRVGVYSPTPTNHKLLVRRNRDFQCSEYFAGVPRTRLRQAGAPLGAQQEANDADGMHDRHLDSDGIRLFEWLRSTSSRTHSPQDPRTELHHGAWRFYSPAPRCSDGVEVTAIGNVEAYLTRRWVPLS